MIRTTSVGLKKVPEIETCVTRRRRKLLYKLPERLQIFETYTAKSQNTTFMLFAKVKVWKHQGKKENERKNSLILSRLKKKGSVTRHSMIGVNFFSFRHCVRRNCCKHFLWQWHVWLQSLHLSIFFVSSTVHYQL